VAAFGLAWVSGLLVELQLCLRLIGGLFLVYLGVRTFLEKPVGTADSTPIPVSTGLAKSYAATFVLTVANPMTIFSPSPRFSPVSDWKGPAEGIPWRPFSWRGSSRDRPYGGSF
jgi:threonine/homoserine/homoserine lactone efflux protein